MAVYNLRVAELWLPPGPEHEDNIRTFYHQAGWGEFSNPNDRVRRVFHPLLHKPTFGLIYKPIVESEAIEGADEEETADRRRFANGPGWPVLTYAGAVLKMPGSGSVQVMRQQLQERMPASVIDPDTDPAALPNVDQKGPYHRVHWEDAVILADPYNQAVVLANFTVAQTVRSTAVQRDPAS